MLLLPDSVSNFSGVLVRTKIKIKINTASATSGRQFLGAETRSGSGSAS